MGDKRSAELNKGLKGQEKQWHEGAALYMLNEKQAGGKGEHQEPVAKSSGRCAQETCSQGKSLKSNITQCITRNDSQPGKQTGFANTPHHRGDTENRTRGSWAALSRCRGWRDRHRWERKSIPTFTKSGLAFALDAESMILDSACILRNRSLRSVFCAIAWNI